MQFARYQVDGEVAYGVVDGEQVRRIAGTPFEEYRQTGVVHPLDRVRLLAPCAPSKAVAIALNYRTHLAERRAPTRPEPFFKTPNSIIGPGDTVLLPPDAGRVDEEGELVAVIGRRCRNVSPAEALGYVLGYTCGTDVSARQWQRGDDHDIQWWRAKSSDTFGPIGPVIVTDLDPFAFSLRARINGQEVQRGEASELIFDIPTVISFVSRYVTLEPGDVVFTGTPGATTALNPGDVVEVEVPGIGVLRNPVVAGEVAPWSPGRY